MGLDFDPDFGIAQVIYTYVGPQLLDLVKEALIQNHNVSPEELERFNLAARLKQIDHNDWDATMAQLKNLILTEKYDQSVARLLEKYPFQAGLAIAKWVRNTASTNPSSPSGFFDLFFGENVFHLSNFFKPTSDPRKLPDLLIAISTDVRLLTHRNLRAHLEYLREYLTVPPVQDDEFEVKKAAIPKDQNQQSIVEERSNLQTALNKIKKYEQRLQILQKMRVLLGGYDELERVEINDVKNAIEEVLKRLRSFLNSLRRRGIDSLNFEGLNELDFVTLFRLLSVFREIETKEIANTLGISSFLSEEERHLLQEVEKKGDRRQLKRKDLISEFIASYDEEVVFLQNRMDELKEQVAISQRRLAELKASKRESGRKIPVRFFPLSENLIIAYASQFVFDPDFREFLRRVALIQNEELFLSEDLSPEEKRKRRLEDKKRKGEEIQRLCQLIFPKLEAYLFYIFEGGDYPQIRFTRIFN